MFTTSIISVIFITLFVSVVYFWFKARKLRKIILNMTLIMEKMSKCVYESEIEEVAGNRNRIKNLKNLYSESINRTQNIYEKLGVSIIELDHLRITPVQRKLATKPTPSTKSATKTANVTRSAVANEMKSTVASVSKSVMVSDTNSAIDDDTKSAMVDDTNSAMTSVSKSVMVSDMNYEKSDKCNPNLEIADTPVSESSSIKT